jgi:hypothetical protein
LFDEAAPARRQYSLNPISLWTKLTTVSHDGTGPLDFFGFHRRDTKETDERGTPERGMKDKLLRAYPSALRIHRFFFKARL